jgi:hypothetical protein
MKLREARLLKHRESKGEDESTQMETGADGTSGNETLFQGGGGIINKNRTDCFVLALIQLLCHIPDFVKWLRRV